MLNSTRDFIGYGQNQPRFRWPNGAGLAINIVINYESGAERCILDGDETSENYLVDIPECSSFKNRRNLSAESIFEYGSRCGIWRLHRIIDQFEFPVTIFACGQALQSNPEYASYLKKSIHEVAGHGYKWIDYSNISIDRERQHIQKTIGIIEEMTNKAVLGWYTGRKSGATQDLLSEMPLIYHSDSYADDLPFWQVIKKKRKLVIPYTLVTNDFRYSCSPGFSCAQDFYLELKAAFDLQYAEAREYPQLLTIALHDRLSGRPSRAHALLKFLNDIIHKKDIWIATRAEIAKFYYQSLLP
jgi:allantoinase